MVMDSLLQATKCRKTEYFSHITRNRKYNLLELLHKGKTEGRLRESDVEKKSWMDVINEWSGCLAIKIKECSTEHQHPGDQI